MSIEEESACDCHWHRTGQYDPKEFMCGEAKATGHIDFKEWDRLNKQLEAAVRSIPLDLKPCPFCGAKPIIYKYYEPSEDDVTLGERKAQFSHHCTAINTTTSNLGLGDIAPNDSMTLTKKINAWNTRASTEQPGGKSFDEWASDKRFDESPPTYKETARKAWEAAMATKRESGEEKFGICCMCNNALGAKNGWQDIKTAPKDGRPFLALMKTKYQSNGIAYTWCRVLHESKWRLGFQPWDGIVEQADIAGWMPLPTTNQIEGGN